MSGFSIQSVPETYLTVVMNTRNLAITEYQSYGFNSYATVNGVFCGVNSSGLFELDGDDDAGTNIDWSVKTGQLDDKSVLLKRVPEVVVGLRSSGPIRVRVYKDDTEYYDEMLPATDLKTIHQQYVHPGKGMRSRYFSVELQGMGGSAAEIDSLQVNMTRTTRRVG